MEFIFCILRPLTSVYDTFDIVPRASFTISASSTKLNCALLNFIGTLFTLMNRFHYPIQFTVLSLLQRTAKQRTILKKNLSSELMIIKTQLN